MFNPISARHIHTRLEKYKFVFQSDPKCDLGCGRAVSRMADLIPLNSQPHPHNNFNRNILGLFTKDIICVEFAFYFNQLSKKLPKKLTFEKSFLGGNVVCAFWLTKPCLPELKTRFFYNFRKQKSSS